MPILNKQGRLGEKTGKGFYAYTDRKPKPDPAVKAILLQSQQAAGFSEVCLLIAARPIFLM
jgi:3-hydroxyacyl-CoA dehydrogenase